jgi:hypothetical protein
VGLEYTRTGAFRATSSTSVQLDIPIVPDQERLGFNVRKFASRWNLDGAKGGGVHMWREVWDDDVSLIYRDILGNLLFYRFSLILMLCFCRYGGTYLWPPTQSRCLCASQAAKEIYLIDHMAVVPVGNYFGVIPFC